MKILLLALISIFSMASYADVYVHPYQKNDGSTVPGHYRTAPNSTKNDNYSTQGNINPHNGREGTKPRDGQFNSN
ncbi:MAG TPA: hypothetical protein VLI69_04700 [Gammaproteobacteria bacterium]|nr:hypothetical protein [Gammaproteobacteria bacterium]